MLRRVAPCIAATLLVASHAEAFCGFYVSGSSEGLTNKATRAVLMRSGTRTVLSMQNDYDGPPEDFAMVVPVPVVLSRDTVRTLPHDVFAHLESLTAPRLVEYWEQNPCPTRHGYDSLEAQPGVMLTADVAERSIASSDDVERHVRVEARFAVGEYEVVILSADESSALDTWLRSNRYNIPRGAAAALGPYVRGAWKFFVARVDIERAQRRPGGGVRLSPLRMHYDSDEFRLPVRLGLLNAPPDAQDLIVYVLHPSARFEVANYPNVFVPTNLDLVEGSRTRFASLYGALFDATVASAGHRAVVTEYAWTTGGCDPCPTPPLEANDLATLGADTLGDFNGSAMVVTRLHARYNAATLNDDLVFREAYPVTGGHEAHGTAMGEAETRALRSSRGNAFQARYVIRHPWTGPMTCEHPRRGVWGGPPPGTSAPLQVASDLAEVPRTNVSLREMVRTPLTAVDLDARLTLPTTGSVVPPPTAVPSAGLRRGCACGTIPRAASLPMWGVCAVALGAAVFRRRRALLRCRDVPSA
jgi:hypothetical protein